MLFDPGIKGVAMTFIHHKNIGPMIFLITAVFALSACQTAAVYTSDILKRPDASIKVVVMPIDIELSELNAGGSLTTRADWSEAARGYMETELNAFLATKNVSSAKYVPLTDNVDPHSKEVQLSKLFGTVGTAISIHQYIPAYNLPTKANQFDWSLGPDVKVIADRYDADYALFTYIRDSYTTAGRAAVIIFAAILGAGVQGGQQYGYASLVDLRSGEIVWFNRLARGTGDLRTGARASETVDALMIEFPK